MRKLLVSVLAAGLLGALVAPALAATKKVTIGDNYFVRASGVPSVTVDKDTKVTWVWKGNRPHNVKVARGPATFGSSTMSSGRYSKRVTKRGTYAIYCSVHGADDQSMKLVVR